MLSRQQCVYEARRLGGYALAMRGDVCVRWWIGLARALAQDGLFGGESREVVRLEGTCVPSARNNTACSCPDPQFPHAQSIIHQRVVQRRVNKKVVMVLLCRAVMVRARKKRVYGKRLPKPLATCGNGRCLLARNSKQSCSWPAILVHSLTLSVLMRPALFR